ncbi:glycosyltransferase family 4 protein [uncultured Pseudoteredinibacter sp.]|uniref:glycosyltransferase family 4 protein n=1 Tax=uncultured Pseudoteredinibacter sp. TaxID=1641701 RepID=UPI0026368104|nr:glycosyltransferase family 4 protein [uncultured Pseudoteredinibacter sp.]
MNSFSQNIADSNANNRADTDAQRSLRICLLGYRSAPFVGGQGIYIKYLSKALVDAGHQVDVISGPPYPDLDPRVKLIEMPSLDLFSAPNHVTALRPKHLKSFSDTFEWWSMLTGGFAEPYTFSRRVAKYLKIHGHRYDLVHDNQCLGWGLLSIQKRGLPVVATVHHPITRDRQLALNAAQGWKDRLLVKRWHSFLRMQKRVVQKLNHIVTVSEQSRHDIADAFDISSDDISLVYNGIDTETFRPRSDIEKKPLQLITTASADQPLKGLRYLLDAMANLREDFPELQLLVVGKLREDGDTAKQLKKLKLEQQVRFVSGISTEELVQHYNASSIAVSPSLYEGFGLPAGEAMACGTAVISSDGGALPEIVGDVGVVVPAGNAEALSKAIAELLQDPERRQEMGLRCRERIEEKFSWKVAAEQFGQYYQQMLAERK